MTHPAEPYPTAYRYDSAPYRWYSVAVMMAIYLSQALDRNMATILVEPIKHEFRLSDAQMGLYSGSAFGVSLALAVLPMGYLSDRVVRTKVLPLVVAVWSFCTMLAGFSRTYPQLVATRIAVGASEAGAAPIILPMAGDIFPHNRRGLVIGALYTSTHFGQIIAGLLGAYIAATHGWRMALLVAGVPGLVAAALMFFTLDEPRRGAAEDDGATHETAPPLREVFAFLWRNPAVSGLIMAGALMGLVSIIMGVWASSFFIRVHGLSLKQAGLIIGLGVGGAGVFGPPAFGWLGDRLSSRDPAWPLRLVWIGGLFTLATALTMLYSPFVGVAIGCFILNEFIRTGYPPPTYSTLMSKTPVRMRGTVMSIVQLSSNLVGYGLGPVMIGLLSDFYGGGRKIREALVTGNLVVIPIVILLFTLSNRGLFGRRAKIVV